MSTPYTLKAACRKAYHLVGQTWMAKVNPQEARVLIAAGAKPIDDQGLDRLRSSRACRLFFYFQPSERLRDLIKTERIRYSNMWYCIHAKAWE